MMIVLDTVYMLYSEKEQCLIYRCGRSAQEVWAIVIDEEIMGTGVTKTHLQARGFKAKKVKVCEPL